MKYQINSIDDTIMQTATDNSHNANECDIIYRILRMKKINNMVNIALNPSSLAPFISTKPESNQILFNMNMKRSHPAMNRVIIAGKPKEKSNKRHFKNIKSSHAFKIFIDCKK